MEQKAPAAAFNPEEPAAPSPALIVSTVTDQEAFAALKPEWDELSDDSTASMFNSWRWLYPWFKHRSGGRGLHLLIARDAAGRLMGLLPLCRSVQRSYGVRVRRLSSMADDLGSHYLDVVARRGAETAVASALLGHLARTSADWDVLDLSYLDADSPTLALLHQTFGQGSLLSLMEKYSPHEPLVPGESFDAFLKRAPRGSRFVKRRRWLSREPQFRLEKIEDPARAPEALQMLSHLQSARWARDGRAPYLADPARLRYATEVIPGLMEGGRAVFYVMWMGDKPMAMMLGFLSGKRFQAFQNAFDPAFRTWSAGFVLLGEVLRDCFEQGFTDYDLGRDPEPYKDEWCSKRKTLLNLRVVPRRDLKSRFLRRADDAGLMATRWAARSLPPALAERLTVGWWWLVR